MKKLLQSLIFAFFTANLMQAQSINFTSPEVTQAEIGSTITVDFEYSITSDGYIYCAIELLDDFTYQSKSTVADAELNPAIAGTNVTGSFDLTIPDESIPTSELTGNLNYKIKIELKDGNFEYLDGQFPSTQINLAETLSNDSFENKPSFAIYPNPAADRIQLAGLENNVVSSVKIFNTFGKQVKSFSIMEEYFDVSTLSEGVYFVRIENGNTAQTLKFVKR